MGLFDFLGGSSSTEVNVPPPTEEEKQLQKVNLQLAERTLQQLTNLDTQFAAFTPTVLQSFGLVPTYGGAPPGAAAGGATGSQATQVETAAPDRAAPAAGTAQTAPAGSIQDRGNFATIQDDLGRVYQVPNDFFEGPNAYVLNKASGGTGTVADPYRLSSQDTQLFLDSQGFNPLNAGGAGLGGEAGAGGGPTAGPGAVTGISETPEQQRLRESRQQLEQAGVNQALDRARQGEQIRADLLNRFGEGSTVQDRLANFQAGGGSAENQLLGFQAGGGQDVQALRDRAAQGGEAIRQAGGGGIGAIAGGVGNVEATQPSRIDAIVNEIRGGATDRQAQLINEAIASQLAAGRIDIDRAQREATERLREELAPQLGLRPTDTPIVDRAGRVAAEAARQEGQLVQNLRGQAASDLLRFPLQEGQVTLGGATSADQLIARLMEAGLSGREALAALGLQAATGAEGLGLTAEQAALQGALERSGQGLEATKSAGALGLGRSQTQEKALEASGEQGLTQRSQDIAGQTNLLSLDQAAQQFQQGLGEQAKQNRLNLATGLSGTGLNIATGGPDPGALLNSMKNERLGMATQTTSSSPGLLDIVAGGAKVASLFGNSDRRLKSAPERIGALADGTPVYRYRIDGEERVGVMAQDLEKTRPWAVVRDPETGYLAIDYRWVDGLDAPEPHRARAPARPPAMLGLVTERAA